MYQIFCDDNIVYDLRYEEFIVESPTLTLEVNKASSLSFSIHFDHPYYHRLNKLSSIIKVVKDGNLLFKGRIITEQQNLYNQKYIECESMTAFLNDSIHAPFNFNGKASQLFGSIIDQHNLQVADHQKIRVGNVTLKDADTIITVNSTKHINSYQLLQSELFNKVDGYTIERYVGENLYLDYLYDVTKTAKQEIRLGENLIDLVSKNDASETYTIVIPLGAEIEEEIDEDGNVITEAHTLTIGSVNNGKDYLVDQEAFSQYGWIVAPIEETTWEDITTASELYNKGKQYLKSQAIMMKNTIELTALDLSIVDINVESFSLGETIRLYSEPHGIDVNYLLRQMTIPFDHPENMTISLGQSVDTLTGIQFNDKKKVDDTIQKVEIINADYVKNKQLTAVKEETLKSVSSIIQDSEKITLEVIETLESNLKDQIGNIETLQVSLNVNLPTTQVYDYDTNIYTPNYVNQNLIITPVVKLGNTIINPNLCSFEWYQDSVKIATTNTITINKNLNAITTLYRCVVTYTKETKTYSQETVINLSLITNGKKGQDGAIGENGKSISTITEYYLISNQNTGITTATSGWTTTVPTMTITNKYLWNYEKISFSDGTTMVLTPRIIGVYGDTGIKGSDGIGIKSITNYYLASASSSGVTTSTTGWTTSIQTISTSKKYLWNYEIITYSNDTTSTTTPIIIGVYGDTGASGKDSYNVIIVPSATQFISQNNGTSYIPTTITLTPTFQNCNYNIWQYSTNGSTWTTVNSGSNGLTIANQILTISNTSELFDSNSSISFKALSDVSNVANTITIAKMKYVSDLQEKLDNLDTNLLTASDQIKTIATALKVLDEGFDVNVKQTWEAVFGEEYTAVRNAVTALQLSLDNFSVSFSTKAEVSNSVDKLSTEISKYLEFRKSDGALYIGDSSSGYQARINNDSFDILKGGNMVATFSDSMMTTNYAKITSGLELGKIVAQSYVNGVVFKWGG